MKKCYKEYRCSVVSIHGSQIRHFLLISENFFWLKLTYFKNFVKNTLRKDEKYLKSLHVHVNFHKSKFQKICLLLVLKWWQHSSLHVVMLK